MASTRKPRNVNRRYGKAADEWFDKEEAAAAATTKNKSRKRKLSDMLGPQWSKEELERFYDTYRKYGKDWRKVASTMRNRSQEMVEALYNMNKAYLSLPEGTATVAGLIAMMTDHYNVLERSDSDRESNDQPRTSRRPLKRGRGKYRLMSKDSEGRVPDLLQYQSTPSSYGCLPLLKRKRSGELFAGRSRAVGKRTPRVPVTNVCNNYDKDSMLSHSKHASQSELSTGADEGAHVAALALAEAFQRVDSPQVSRTPGRRGDRVRISSVHSGERKNEEPDMADSKAIDVQMDADCLEGSLGSRGAENCDFSKDASFMVDTDGASTLKIHQKENKLEENRTRTAGDDNDHSDDDREACSGTEERRNVRQIKDEYTSEAIECRISKRAKSSRVNSRQLYTDNESSAFDALQTLADLSLHILLPSSTVESESSAQNKEENINFDNDKKPGIPDPLSANHRSGSFEATEKPGVDSVSRKGAKGAKGLTHLSSAFPEEILEAKYPVKRIQKRKRKSYFGKISKSEVKSKSKVEPFVVEASVEDGSKSVQRVKRSSQVYLQTRQGKSSKSQENPSSTHLNKNMSDTNETSMHVYAKDQLSMPTKLRSRRKIDPQKLLAGREGSTGEDCPDKKLPVVDNRLPDFKEMLSHCLSSPTLRKWCLFEWFYSAIDYPWFAKTEFVEYLNHVQLGHIPRLTRVEWGVIRSSLGKPRRLSKKFLQEEREKLEQYRESVRTHYAELRNGIREGLPTDLARPLSVGQRVSSCHPKTREIHDGSVLTVDRSRCRVQFDRPELGVEFVMDVDCMPINPLENMPEVLRRQNVVMNRFCNIFMDGKLEDQYKELKNGGSTKYSESLDNADSSCYSAPPNYPMNTLMEQAKGDTVDAIVQAKAAVNEVVVAAQQAMYNQPYTLAQIQAREADIRALVEVARALDKKEALLIELRHMNEEVSGVQKDSSPAMNLDNFRKQYATVLVQLRDTNAQVASSLIYMRKRNTYTGYSTPSWHKPMESSGGPASHQGSLSQSTFLAQDIGPNVLEIIQSSSREAKSMVDEAVQAALRVKEGEDVFVVIGEALGIVNNRNTGFGPGISSMKHTRPDPGHDTSVHRDHTAPCKSEPTTGRVSPKPLFSHDRNEVQLSSELVSTCVATLCMIQICAERQFPPAEVAHILDSAITCVQPRCPQNLPIYREIETCMGIIKNLMLALIPTLCSVLPIDAPPVA